MDAAGILPRRLMQQQQQEQAQQQPVQPQDVEPADMNARQWAARHRGSRNSACERCVRQKSKCVYRDASGACERCISSHKECKAPPGRQIIPSTTGNSNSLPTVSSGLSPPDSVSSTGSSIHMPLCVPLNAESTRKRSAPLDGFEISGADSQSRQKPRYEELEERVNHLYSLLDSQNRASIAAARPDYLPLGVSGSNPAGQPLTPVTGQGSPSEDSWNSKIAPPKPLLHGFPSPPVDTGSSPTDPTGCGIEFIRKMLPNTWRNLPQEQLAACATMSLEEGEQAYEKYKEMVNWFPFVVIDPSIGFFDLAQERPYLAFAIYIACSTGNIYRRHELFSVFRDAWSQRCVVRGERNLDFLQSIVLVMSWSHLYMCRSAPIMVFWINMAASIGNDLNKMVIQHNKHPTTQRPMTDQHAEKADIIRAQLGAYILSLGVIKLGQCQLGNIPLSDELLDQAYMLGSKRMVESDQAVPYIVELHKIAEEARDTLPAYEDRNVADRPATKMLRRQLLQRIEHLSSTFPPIRSGRKGFEMAEYYARAIVNEPIALTTSKEPPDDGPIAEPSEYQLSLLAAYNQTALSLSKKVGEQSLSEFRCMTIVHWIQTLSSAIQLARISALDSKFARDDATRHYLREKTEEILDYLTTSWETACAAAEGEKDQSVLWIRALTDALKWFMRHGNQRQLGGRPLHEVTRLVYEESYMAKHGTEAPPLTYCTDAIPPEPETERQPKQTESNNEIYDDIFAGFSWDDLMGNLNVFQTF